MSRWRTAERDRGASLVEMLVTIVLLGVVSAIVTSAVLASSKLLAFNDDESRGLADVKTVAERLDRDIRDARAVVCDGAPLPDGTPDPGCGSHLQLWVDTNSNYKLDAAEVITWQLVPLGDGNHYKVTRTRDAVVVVEATSLVVNFAFTYDTPPTASYQTSATRTVATGMVYDALYGSGTASRTLTFQTRLRNVA